MGEKRNAEPGASSGHLAAVGGEGGRTGEKHSRFSGEVGGGTPEGQLGVEPNPGQLVRECQEKEKK